MLEWLAEEGSGPPKYLRLGPTPCRCIARAICWSCEINNIQLRDVNNVKITAKLIVIKY